jgi:hypothetical protein
MCHRAARRVRCTAGYMCRDNFGMTYRSNVLLKCSLDSVMICGKPASYEAAYQWSGWRSIPNASASTPGKPAYSRCDSAASSTSRHQMSRPPPNKRANPITADRQRRDIVGPTSWRVITQRLKARRDHHITGKRSRPLRREVNDRMEDQAGRCKRGRIGKGGVLASPENRCANTLTPQRKSLFPVPLQLRDECLAIF